MKKSLNTNKSKSAVSAEKTAPTTNTSDTSLSTTPSSVTESIVALKEKTHADTMHALNYQMLKIVTDKILSALVEKGLLQETPKEIDATEYELLACPFQKNPNTRPACKFCMPTLGADKKLFKCSSKSCSKTDVEFLEQLGLSKLRIPETIEFIRTGALVGNHLVRPGQKCIEYAKVSKKDNKFSALGGSLRVTAVARDKHQQNWSRLVSWDDINNEPHEDNFSLSDLSSRNTKVIEFLTSRGWLPYTTSAALSDLVRSFILLFPVYKFIRSTDQTGWYGDVFVLPNKVIGSSTKEDVRFLENETKPADYSVSGTLEDWQNNVSKPATLSPYLTACICAAAAGPLVRPLNEEGFLGLHLSGPSKLGKTLCLSVAEGFYGHPDHRMTKWNTSKADMVNKAAGANDTTLGIDELSANKSNPRDVVEMIFTLSSGKERGKVNGKGNSHIERHFSGMMISTGELSVNNFLKADKVVPSRGLEMRLINISVKPGDSGIFLNANPCNFGKLASELYKSSRTYYGTPGHKWLEALANMDKDKLRQDFADFDLSKALNNQKLKMSDPQLQQVFRIFKKLAFAGKLATEMGITGWKLDDMFNSLSMILSQWITDNGTGTAEFKGLVTRLKNFIDTHPTNFHELKVGKNGRQQAKRKDLPKLIYGYVTTYKKRNVYFVLNDIFKSDKIIGTYNKGFAIEDLARHKILLRIPSGRDPQLSIFFDDSQVPERPRGQYIDIEVLSNYQPNERL